MSRTILLADDSLTIQKVVELTFADTEYEVTAVSSGDELLQRLPAVKPDLVICDVIMPGRDGYEVCQEIKSSPDFLHLPVILLTGTFEPFDRDRAIAVGCSEIITKPFEAKKLVDAVERLASSPAAPSLSSADTQSIGPNDLADRDVEGEFDDTQVSQEFGPGEVMAAETDDVAFEEVHDVSAELPPVEPPQEDFAFGGEDGAFELETADLPDVEVPPDLDQFEDLTPDPARTLAAESFAAMMESEEVEALSLDEPSLEQEPFIHADVQGEPFPSGDEANDDRVREDAVIDTSLTTPIDVGAAMVNHEPEVVESDWGEDVPVDDAVDDADTQDFGEASPAGDAPHNGGAVNLSDEDVDRIARRLLELAADRIEHIAWDVIPDMAEVVVRERVRELEAEAEREPL